MQILKHQAIEGVAATMLYNLMAVIMSAHLCVLIKRGSFRDLALYITSEEVIPIFKQKQTGILLRYNLIE